MIQMKKLLCGLLIICTVFTGITVESQTVQAKNTESVDVYAKTEKEFYQYINTFFKGDYKELRIHFKEDNFKIDEYKEGINGGNSVLNRLSPFHDDVIYSSGSSQYTLFLGHSDSQNKAKKLEKKANSIIKKIIKPNMSKQQKITAIAKYMKKNVTYDYAGLKKASEYAKSNNITSFTLEQFHKFTDMFSAYGALCKGKSVCEGYSRAFNLLARKANIPSIHVTTDVHAWNIYKIGNKYYEIDTTRQETKGHLLTKKSQFKEKKIYKDLFKYVVLGTNKVEMTPYNLEI